MKKTNPNPPIYTIGYGSRSIDDFIKVLHANEIAFLIDVRSRPYSKFNQDYSKAQLETNLAQVGIRYVFMGDTLGGQPDVASVYTPEGKVDYEKIKEKDFYRRGVERLHDARNQNLKVVLMCSEGKPENCHRSKLIGVTLTAEGVDIVHIDENNHLISQEQVLLRLTGGQFSLPGLNDDQFTSRKPHKPPENKDEHIED